MLAKSYIPKEELDKICATVAAGSRNVKTQTQLFSGLGVLHWQFIDEQLFLIVMSIYRFH